MKTSTQEYGYEYKQKTRQLSLICMMAIIFQRFLTYIVLILQESNQYQNIVIFQNQISRNLGKLMSTQESKILRIQLYHSLIGIHNFDVNSRQNFSELRAMLSETTQIAIFENFRFSVNGKLLPQFQEIGQVINNQTRINLVLEPFDQKSSYFHLERVKDILASPVQWVMLNSRQTHEQKQFADQKLPQNVSIDNFLDSQISSPLYQSQSIHDKHIIFLQQLNFSIHNPPSMHRKLAGDFYYIMIRTLEGHEEHITACPQGFYINNSTNSCLNTTNQSGIYFYNLLDLFKYLSPKFKQLFNSLRKIYKLTELDKSIYNTVKSSPKCEWLKSNTENIFKKTKYNQWRHFTFNISNDATNIKQWNQIIQLHSVYVADSQIDSTNRQKNLYKLYQEFVCFAKQAAVKAVEGQIPPTNPQSSLSKRTFKYGAVYLWFTDDDAMSYANVENSKLTRKALNTSLKNLQWLEKHKQIDLNFKHFVLVSYKGHTIVVQPLISGINQIYQNKQSQKKFQKSIVEQLGKQMSIESKILYKNEKDETQRAFIHPQIQCLKPEDKRTYMTNLHVLSARDLNFPSPRSNGCVFRKQLVKNFNQKQNCYKNINTMIGKGYNLVFNQKINEQHMKLKSLKVYAEQIAVPLCIKSFLRNNKKYLADSKSVLEVLHKFGLSSRYLGSIYKRASDLQASHIKPIIERVAIVKTLKNMFRQIMRKTELGDIKLTICRLLNCIFCNEFTLNSMDESFCKDDLKDQISTNASRKKKKKPEIQWEYQQEQLPVKTAFQSYNQIKPSQLWDQVKQIAAYRYGIVFLEKKIYELKCLQNEFGKSAMLRDICICVGFVIEKIDYFSKQGIIFKPQHIQQVKPIAKFISISNRFLDSLIDQGDSLIERKRIEEAIDVYNQAINYATSNFGVMNDQLAILNRKVGQIYFRISQIDAAMLFVHCSQKMCQKIFGESHVQTLQCYNLLSQFNFFIGKFETAEYYLMKSIHLSTISYGQYYPELISNYLNLGTVYEASFRFMDSITSISHALRIALKIFGQQHLNTAICYAAMSTAHFQIPDIQKSIFFQEESISILKKILKADDLRLKQAQKVLQYYHHLQSTKKVKQNHEKQKKKMISNPQLFAGFPLFRFPQYNPKQRDFMYKKFQNLIQFPPKYFL